MSCHLAAVSIKLFRDKLAKMLNVQDFLSSTNKMCKYTLHDNI